MIDRISFYDQIARNKRNSVFLMLIIIVVLIAIFYVIALIFQQYYFSILSLGIVVTIIYVLISYYNSDKIALASVNAKEADPREYRQLHNIIEGLCIASGMPKPRIYVMPGKQINAFASGRDPKNSVVCVTEGALSQLNKQELEGVLAHELSHVANYDIRFMTLAAVMVGMIAIVSQMFLRSLWFGNTGNSRDDRAGAILLLVGVVLAILAPIVVQLVQLAISRKREYAADASSVKFTRSPTGLINALKKIKQDSEKMKVSGAVAPLFIADPMKKLSNLFQTHPPLESRIKILEQM